MNLPKLNLRDNRNRTTLLIVLIGVVLAVFWHEKIYKDRNAELTSLKSEFTARKARLTQIMAMKPQRNKLIEDIEHQRQILDSLKSIFPDQKEIPRLIRDITRLARASGIYTTKFVPLQDQEREYYVENRYAIGMWGGFHELGVFLSRMANLTLIINVAKMKITSHPRLNQQRPDGGQGEAPEYTITAQFEMTTFSSKR